MIDVSRSSMKHPNSDGEEGQGFHGEGGEGLREPELGDEERRPLSGCCLSFEAERVGGMWVLQEEEEATIILAMAAIPRMAAATTRHSLSSDSSLPIVFWRERVRQRS